MHVAQLNVAHPRFPLDDARMAEFVEGFDRINATAEVSPGFVWRREDDGTVDPSFADESDALISMSVWETAEHLEQFVWTSVHKELYRRKAEWFSAPAKPYFVMWPVPEDHRPTLAEGRARLDHLAAHGSTEFAYGWDGLPHLKLWMTARCA
jgi:hypothetical protein